MNRPAERAEYSEQCTVEDAGARLGGPLTKLYRETRL
jgi:hypothetical protein